MTRRLLAASALGLSASAQAHPHSVVEQQALLSLGRTKAVVTYAIMPSWKDGAHMFGHLDANGDGRLSDAEQTIFAWRLLATTRLTIDGAPSRLRLTKKDFPDRERISSGSGLIRVTVEAAIALPATQRHAVSLGVSNQDFGSAWFLQSYYFADLIAGPSMPKLVRSPGGGITVSVPAAS